MYAWKLAGVDTLNSIYTKHLGAADAARMLQYKAD
jgi:hypothetical protein